MKKLCCVIYIILLNQIVFGQESRSIRESIIPLLSTRLEVEKVVLPLREGRNDEYETEKEKITINYSKKQCLEHGWNVKPDTVIDYTVYPKEKISIDVLDKSISQLIHTSDDAGYSYYTNLQKGIQYLVNFEKSIESIRYTPAETDSKFRCKGFPEYNPVAENYRPYDTYYLGETSNWDVGKVGGFLIEIEKSPKAIGYIFVYAAKKESKATKKESKAEIGRIIKKLETFAYKVMRVNPQKLKIAFGGYRDESEMEAFLIPNKYPTPIPKPKYPS